MLQTPLGRIASTCAAVGDVTAWSLLAFVVAIARSADSRSTVFCLGLVLVFLALMFVGIKPNLPRWLGREALERPTPSKGILAIVIAIV